MKKKKRKIDIIKQKLSFDIDEQILLNILFEMGKYYDKQFVEEIHRRAIRINSHCKKNLRLYYYYGKDIFLKESGVNDFPRYEPKSVDKVYIIDSFIDRCVKYSENRIIKSIEERYNLIKNELINDNSYEWLEQYYEKRSKECEFSLFILDYSQNDFIVDKYNVNNIFKVIADIYDRLENYRYFIFKLNGKLFDKLNEDVTWKILYKVGIYCENFILFEEDYFPFKKENRISEMVTFLNARFDNIDNERIAREFYTGISTGFKFEDCLVSENQSNIILTFQKIKLDKREVPCPSCMKTIQSGNSYPEVFKKSFECKNPSCSERSKSGRGKRFDEYGTLRYFKLVENNQNNIISDRMYKQWRRDIFSDRNNVYEMLIKYYSWNKDIICSTKKFEGKMFGRKLCYYIPQKNEKYITSFEELPIYRLMSQVYEGCSRNRGDIRISSAIEIRNADSTEEIDNLQPGQIGTAITSPPYYNAREYSQWANLVLYLIDMERNGNSIYKALKRNGYYLYNIGDIVDADNIYVASNMSNRRLQLGFYSSMIYEICGFNLVGNIIWDKGEVQSKRNSTPNHNSGYIRSINCYEHILILKKGHEKTVISSVKHISPVIKMGKNGKNRVGHTAPYPLELVELIRKFADKKRYILDPFLGSGTTLVWCKQNGYKGIGYELLDDYYSLAFNRVNEIEEV